MPFVARIGDIVQTPAEVTVEWRVEDFFSLPDKFDDFYESPIFTFSDSLWCLRLHPNGDSYHSEQSTGIVNIRLVRLDSGPSKDIKYTFGYKCSDGVEKRCRKYEESFSTEIHEWPDGYWEREELQRHASGSLPDNSLTITCHLKYSDQNGAKVSWSRRVWDVSSSMEAVLSDGKRSDFTLKLGDRDWPVHKVILEGRCEYFANMFRHDWVENTVGEVTFEDVEEDALDSVLRFVYTGDVRDMSEENVCDMYVAAHKFLLDDLKTLCVEFMKGEKCEEMVYKALVIADTYGDEDLRETAIDYLMDNADTIFHYVKWKEFKKNHLSIAADILQEIANRERSRRKEERKSFLKSMQKMCAPVPEIF